MTHWRYILNCVCMTALAIGQALAAEMPIDRPPATVQAARIAADPSLPGSSVNDEELGRVSGGTALLATTEIPSLKLFAVVLWDEVKPKRDAQFEPGNGQTSITTLIQGR